MAAGVLKLQLGTGSRESFPQLSRHNGHVQKKGRRWLLREHAGCKFSFQIPSAGSINRLYFSFYTVGLELGRLNLDRMSLKLERHQLP